MANIRKLIEQLASQEKLLSETKFLAPCVKGSQLRTSVDKIVYTMKPQPADFEGWGIFKPIDNRTAEVIDEASLPQIAAYLELFKPLRVRLAYCFGGQSWLAYPINQSDMQQRLGIAKPLVVHLVTEGAVFETMITRYDGSCFWFDQIDRLADPQPTTQLATFLQSETSPDHVHFAGMTPEMLTTYDLAWQQTPTAKAQQRHRQEVEGKKVINTPQPIKTDEQRLRQALKQGGGSLQYFRDYGDYWQVEWSTSDGENHVSAISKDNLTVLSAGICLSDRDRDFDLQSLVPVVEQQQW